MVKGECLRRNLGLKQPHGEVKGGTGQGCRGGAGPLPPPPAHSPLWKPLEGCSRKNHTAVISSWPPNLSNQLHCQEAPPPRCLRPAAAVTVNNGLWQGQASFYTEGHTQQEDREKWRHSLWRQTYPFSYMLWGKFPTLSKPQVSHEKSRDNISTLQWFLEDSIR